MGSQNEGESIQRYRLVFIRTLNFPLTRNIHVIVMMRGKMGMNERRVVVMTLTGPGAMNVLERRQNKGGHKCQTALDRESAPHQEQCTAGPELTRGQSARVHPLSSRNEF
jgi:hypothetical protein